MIRVIFATEKLKRTCEAGNMCGPAIGAKVVQRINELCASANPGTFMHDMKHLHCHKLQPLSRGHYAAKVTGNYRLIFVPVDDLDREIYPEDPRDIVALKILDVVDYH